MVSDMVSTEATGGARLRPCRAALVAGTKAIPWAIKTVTAPVKILNAKILSNLSDSATVIAVLGMAVGLVGGGGLPTETREGLDPGAPAQEPLTEN